MRDAPFDACWHRWDRAEKIRTELPQIWNEYIEQHPYDFSLDSRGDGVYVLRVWQTQPMPREFAVAMGEWLYNLRSTLDYVIWATAVHVSGRRPPPGESALQYPIYDKESGWDANKGKLKHLAPHHREMLRSMQPCFSNRDANFLGWINRLARIDRHRRLMDGTAHLAILEPAVEVPAGSEVDLWWGERVLVDGWADAVRIRVRPWSKSTRVAMNPRFGLDPEIREWAESPFWSGIRFDQRLVLMQTFVAAEIALYEYDCTGASRKEALVADDFKSESDSRRAGRKIESPLRRDIDWQPAGNGRPSTRKTVDGGDFPPHGPGPIGRGRTEPH